MASGLYNTSPVGPGSGAGRGKTPFIANQFNFNNDTFMRPWDNISSNFRQGERYTRQLTGGRIWLDTESVNSWTLGSIDVEILSGVVPGSGSGDALLLLKNIVPSDIIFFNFNPRGVAQNSGHIDILVSELNDIILPTEFLSVRLGNQAGSNISGAEIRVDIDWFDR